ncbi:MAG: hypothetical protein SCJ93_13335 [Bacillota bacterium]|nr:hypothetical protein [Bacillota bacterium]
MDLITKDDVRTLIEKNKDVSVSIFLPTEKSGKEAMHGKIRLKNLLKETENSLKDNKIQDSLIETMLEPAYKLVDDTTFWQYQKDGLAIFITEDSFDYFKVPVKFNEISMVADQFYIVPLLSQFTGDGEFYLLSLNQNNIKLYQCSQYTIDEIELKDTPKSLSEALKYDVFEKQMSGHSGSGSTTIMHGIETEDRKNQVFRFFQMVDSAVMNNVANRNIPLVLAGVKNVQSIYKKASKYPNIMTSGVEGSTEDLKEDTLHKRAWDIVRSYFKESYEKVIENYKEIKNTDQTSNKIDDIAPAAYNGRIENLILATGFQQWGKYNQQTNEIDLQKRSSKENIELLNFSAVHTFKTDGNVYVVDNESIPGNKPYIANFRY